MTRNHKLYEFNEQIDSIIDVKEPILVLSHNNLIVAVEIAYNSYYLKKLLLIYH
jgi:hypothetical protein